MIPHRVRLSQWATTRLVYMKSKTGLTPNILCRFAFVLSMRDMRKVDRFSDESSGLEFNSPTLFGEYQRMYELLISNYVVKTNDDRDIGSIVSSHIENGLHKMSHVRSIYDIANLK